MQIPRIVQGPDIVNATLLDQICKPTLMDMQRRGTRIDLDWLANIGVQISERRTALDGRIRKRIGDHLAGVLATSRNEDEEEGEDGEKSEGTSRRPYGDFSADTLNLDSPEQMSNFLFNIIDAGRGVANLRLSGDGKRYTTDKKQLKGLIAHYKRMNDLFQAERGFVEDMLEYRELSKLLTTYVRSLAKRAVLHPAGVCPICSNPHAGRYWARVVHREAHYRIHTRFVTTRAATGRIASRYPNLQNIPVRTELGRLIRAAFCGTPGFYWCSGDYSQIELRILALLSQDPRMLQCFINGDDIHTLTAMHVMGVTDPALVPKDVRRAAKTVNFGIVYGLTAEGLASTLALDGVDWELERCQNFIEVEWFNVYEGVGPYMAQQHSIVNRMGYSTDMWGGVRFMSEPKSVHKQIRMSGERMAGNMGVQASASGFMKLAMFAVRSVFDRVRHWGLEAWPLLNIHDELDYETDGHRQQAEVIGSMVQRAMANVIEVPVPIKVDMNPPGERWQK